MFKVRLFDAAAAFPDAAKVARRASRLGD